jgi:hypothetical protein
MHVATPQDEVLESDPQYSFLRKGDPIVRTDDVKPKQANVLEGWPIAKYLAEQFVMRWNDHFQRPTGAQPLHRY